VADPVCSAISLAWGEPLFATASIVRNWLLVEHPGAWGPVALTQSGLATHLSDGLAALSAEHGIRVLLVRRPVRPDDSSRHCFVAHTGRRARWIEERVVDDLDELLAVDFSPMRRGRPVGFGTIRTDPLYLVCTNGRHDQCCANLGRPVARALHARRDGLVWESSHFGGDRFAGNLVCLPHGLYFGRLAPEDAGPVVEGYEAGVVDLEHYRGRAGEPFAAQAAEHFLRVREGFVGVDDLLVTSHRPEGDGVVEVRFDAPGGRSYAVRVQVLPAAHARQLACRSTTEAQPPTYALVAVNGG
jgi:hypothetical protein